ncbi:hypothetical protein ACS0TY_000947 [Phlomoides rotata]
MANLFSPSPLKPHTNPISLVSNSDSYTPSWLPSIAKCVAEGTESILDYSWELTETETVVAETQFFEHLGSESIEEKSKSDTVVDNTIGESNSESVVDESIGEKSRSETVVDKSLWYPRVPPISYKVYWHDKSRRDFVKLLGIWIPSVLTLIYRFAVMKIWSAEVYLCMKIGGN